MYTKHIGLIYVCTRTFSTDFLFDMGMEQAQ